MSDGISQAHRDAEEQERRDEMEEKDSFFSSEIGDLAAHLSANLGQYLSTRQTCLYYMDRRASVSDNHRNRPSVEEILARKDLVRRAAVKVKLQLERLLELFKEPEKH